MTDPDEETVWIGAHHQPMAYHRTPDCPNAPAEVEPLSDASRRRSLHECAICAGGTPLAHRLEDLGERS